MVQWLGLHDPLAGGLGSIPGEGTSPTCRNQELQELRTFFAATKTGPLNKQKHKQILKRGNSSNQLPKLPT